MRFFTIVSLTILYSCSVLLPLDSREGSYFGSVKINSKNDILPAIATNKNTQLNLVYPTNEAKISAPSTFLLGSIPPGSTLNCNGQQVKVNAQGYFAHSIDLIPGVNKFTLQLTNTNNTQQYLLTITRPLARKPLEAGVLQIDKNSLEPSEDLGLVPGDIITFSARATPNSEVSVKIGNRIIPLEPFYKTKDELSSVVTTYGIAYKTYAQPTSDLYVGYYKVNQFDPWDKTPIYYRAASHGKTVSAISKARVSVLKQPLSAHTTSSSTVTRVGPGKGRTTPLVSDVDLIVDGWQGASVRCSLAPGQHIWIDKSQLQFDNRKSMVQPTVTTVNVVPTNTETQIRIPLNQCLPYQVKQQLTPNRLTLQIYGATANTDWITNSAPEEKPSTILDHVTYEQPSDYVYELTAHLKGDSQWGFWVDYEDTTLVLHIKSAPNLIANAKKLSGLIVCLDPGHGGDEPGAIGPSGMRESAINLSIANELAQLLTEDGAVVIMTRTTESENPSLQARQETAITNHANILISIHNNSLPDNRDPWLEHGTSTYWYHPQAIKLAKTLKNSLVSDLNLHDYGTFFDNLALTRPSNLPACLVEVGFMSNPDEFILLMEPDFQKQAAKALLHGIETYFK